VTTVAITGATGTFAHALLPLLEADDRVERVVAIARRPAPAVRGSKVEPWSADVRDHDALAEAFAGADAVAHLAFARFGRASREALHAVNVDGTMNAFEAAAEAGARRFVFASSAAAYGFHPDNPVGMTEEWPARGSERWFYAREKAELERRLERAARRHPGVALTILRPTVVLGPYTAAHADELFPEALRPLVHRWFALRRLPVPPPVVALPQPLQFVHEDDVGAAFMLALRGAPAGTYNLAGEGTVSGSDLVRELGLTPLPVPGALTRTLARGVTALPVRPPALEAVEVATHPVVLDASRARRELGWRPRYTSLEALRATVSSSGSGDEAVAPR
jgi:nucleoside-diphosphate-sugar epimerase